MINLNTIQKNRWILLVLILATFLRLYHIDFQSLWLDEIYTMNVSNPDLTWLEFHKQLLKREGFPHFYFAFLRFLYFVFGYTSVVARSLSAFAGVACVYVIFLIGKELHHYKVGLTAALLLAINEYQIYISQDARPYSLYFLATCLSFHRLIIFIKDNNLKNAIWYGVFTGILLNINFFGMINVCSQVLIILFFIGLTQKNKRFDFFKNTIISGTIALLMFAPNYLMLNKLLKAKVFWVKGPTADSFSIIFKKFFGDWEITWCIIIVLFVFYLIKLFQNPEEKELSISKIIVNKRLFSFIVLFGWFFVFFSFLAIKSYGKISYLLTRYFISISPVLFLVLGISIQSIKGKFSRCMIIWSLSFLTLANLFFVKKYYTDCYQTQFREISFHVLNHNKAQDKVFTEYKYWFDYYFKQKNKSTINISLDKLITQMKNDPKKLQSFWYIGIFKKPYKPDPGTQKFINQHYIIDHSIHAYQVWGKHFVLK